MGKTVFEKSQTIYQHCISVATRDSHIYLKKLRAVSVLLESRRHTLSSRSHFWNFHCLFLFVIFLFLPFVRVRSMFSYSFSAVGQFLIPAVFLSVCCSLHDPFVLFLLLFLDDGLHINRQIPSETVILQQQISKLEASRRMQELHRAPKFWIHSFTDIAQTSYRQMEGSSTTTFLPSEISLRKRIVTV